MCEAGAVMRSSVPRRCLALLPLVLASACAPNVFHTSVKGEATIQASPIPNVVLNSFPAVAQFSNIDFNQDQEFKIQGVTKDQVDSVKVESVALKIVSPNDQDYGFLDNLQIYASAGDSEVLVAERSGIADLGLVAPNPTLMLTVTGAELQPYVTAPSM